MEEILRRRLAHAKRLGSLFSDNSSAAAQCVAALEELIDEALDEVVGEGVEEAKRLPPEVLRHMMTTVQPEVPPQPVPAPPGTKGPVDVFGQTHPAVATDKVTCQSCGRQVTAGKFSPHLEKCLGKGRAAARASSRRAVSGPT
jgi:hypothetical protein